MEQLLDSPSSLLDTLWTYERDAQPLDGPETKAGLKARLTAHCDTIQDTDIRALYRRELLDRFSEFAYPPRLSTPREGWKPGSSRAAARGLSSDAKSALQRMIAGGSRNAFLSAVLVGLLRHPEEIARHSEALARLARLDPSTTQMVETLFEVEETLDSRGEQAISGEQGLTAPPETHRFAFLREGTDPGEAREELAEAVTLLVEKPALNAALAATVARFDEDPEGAFAEQTRLREQLKQVEERLKAFGRRKAAAGSTAATTSPPA